ncbi:MAG: aminotransferase class IV [Mariprofundaceae bacterium]
MQIERIDRGMMYAEACFETLRVINGEVFNWQAHLDRLTRGLETFGIGIPPSLRKEVNTAAAHCGSDSIVRLTIGGGMATWGLIPPVLQKPSVHIMATPYRQPTAPLRLRTVDWPMPLFPRPAKFTADYAYTLRGLQLCKDQLKQGESALVCEGGLCISTTTANLIVQYQNKWWTPAGSHVLPGIVRQQLLIDNLVHESNIPIHWLESCTAMAITNSVCFVRPVQEINGRKLSLSHRTFAPFWRSLPMGMPVSLT